MDLHKNIRNKFKIGVFGSDGDHCSEKAKEIAYEVGKLLAQKEVIVFTGGGDGVMGAASKGATDHKGIVIGIWAGSDLENTNPDSTIIIPTGFGFARGQILTLTVDGAILVEGGLGTHEEAAYMYWYEKPCVGITDSGGTAKEIAGKSLDRRKLTPILKAKDAKEAVEKLFLELKKREKRNMKRK